jgi:hypothetical protein
MPAAGALIIEHWQEETLGKLSKNFVTAKGDSPHAGAVGSIEAFLR